MERRYVSVVETAKLVRKALAESFPGVKFGVTSRSYSGGASIDVRWGDGPTVAEVDEVCGAFKGAYFDGMIDYKGYRYHALDGQPVRFCADWVMTHREHSDALIARALAAVQEEYGVTGTVEDWHAGRLLYVDGHDVQRLVHQALGKISYCETVPGSATLARVTFTGDDGYGQGTVGPDHSGGNLEGKAREEAAARAAAAKERDGKTLH